MWCHGTPGSRPSHEVRAGVGCQRCHGAGADYVEPHDTIGYARSLDLGLTDLRDPGGPGRHLRRLSLHHGSGPGRRRPPGRRRVRDAIPNRRHRALGSRVRPRDAAGRSRPAGRRLYEGRRRPRSGAGAGRLATVDRGSSDIGRDRTGSRKRAPTDECPGERAASGAARTRPSSHHGSGPANSTCAHRRSDSATAPVGRGACPFRIQEPPAVDTHAGPGCRSGAR